MHRGRETDRIAGEYELGEQLGVGGAGAVWEARRLRDGSVVALKLLRSGPASDSRASDRLQREAEALGLTWHPNIVRIFDHGILQSGLGYLVMERLRGETLSARARRLRGLPTREVLRWGIPGSGSTASSPQRRDRPPGRQARQPLRASRGQPRDPEALGLRGSVRGLGRDAADARRRGRRDPGLRRARARARGRRQPLGRHLLPRSELARALDRRAPPRRAVRTATCGAVRRGALRRPPMR